MALKDITQEISGLVDEPTAVDEPTLGDGGGGYQSPGTLPSLDTGGTRYTAFMDEGIRNFQSVKLPASVTTAASSVGGAASSVWSSISSSVSGAWASVTGKSKTPTIALGEVEITGARSSSDSSLLWLWLLLAAGAAFLAYRFLPRGKGGKRKTFSLPRKSGSVVRL